MYAGLFTGHDPARGSDQEVLTLIAPHSQHEDKAFGIRQGTVQELEEGY